LFQGFVLRKIRSIRAENKAISIVVDGGITEDCIQDLSGAGATGVVMGRAVFSAADPYGLMKGISEMA